MGARIPDLETLIQAGIDPKTRLPIRLMESSELKKKMKMNLRLVDEQDAVNRYVWYNLPSGLNGQLLERMLYYKAQLIMFYFNDEFFLLPYALDGTIDVYGRFKEVTPLPFNGVSQGDDKKINPWIQGLTFKPVYDVLDEEFVDVEAIKNSCVILSDYTPQLGEKIVPRSILQEAIIDVMSDCVPFMRTNLINSTGVTGIRVTDQDQSAMVELNNAQFYDAALNGKKYIPITASLEMQELTGGQVANSEEFMLAFQSLDNLRLKFYGLDNGGAFEKKAHELQTEADINANNNARIFNDGLTQRQRFCDIVNSIWGINIWCEPAEASVGDMDMDGFNLDEQDQSGIPNEQPVEGGVE